MSTPSNATIFAYAMARTHQFFGAGVKTFVKEVIDVSNHGGFGAPPAAIDTGELRSSPRIGLNAPNSEEPTSPYLIQIPAQVDEALANFEPGDTVILTWNADHFSIIEGGRRLGSHGRMIGSEQNPDGFIGVFGQSGLAIDVAKARMGAWDFQLSDFSTELPPPLK